MDIWRWVELFEFVIAAGYLLKTARTEKHLTQGLLLGIMGSLLVDISLHLMRYQKPPALWMALNIAFAWFIYEKILRKYCLALYRRLMLALLQLGR